MIPELELATARLSEDFRVMDDDPVNHHAHHGAEHHSSHSTHTPKPPDQPSVFALAVSATLHCLIGCGIGEVAGMLIATALGWGMISSMALAVSLGFVAGLALGMVPLLRSGFNLRQAFKTVIVGEGLSIVVMEAFEVGTALMIPGVMEAGLTDGIFWLGMTAALTVGFIAALPVNYVMIKKGFRHQH